MKSIVHILSKNPDLCECKTRLRDFLSDKDNTENNDDKLLYCSFCGKNQNEVRKLIA